MYSSDKQKENKPLVYEVATAHLDTVWQWTLETTVKKYLAATLHDNFALLEQYPNYRFNFEGAYRYALMKEYYPEEYEQLKQYIASGRWCVCGSSWENGDVVTPEPETLMRNILYGNRFFEREFGKKSNDIFLPDCFGFPKTLPTIMAHMGLTAFSSQKLTWNNGNPPPFHVGIWKGIDGSGVVACINPGPYSLKLSSNPADDASLHDMVDQLPLGVDMRYYGTGDMGGAPTEESAKWVSEAVTTDGLNHVISAYPGQLADELTEEEKASLPVTDEELLMTVHGVGSYTSVAPTKRFHRSNELKADFTERAGVLANWMGAKEYPRAFMEKMYCDFIRHEFHDDLTGTSTMKVYQETFRDDIVVNNALDGELDATLSAISSNINTACDFVCDSDTYIPLVVFNPTAFERDEVAEATIIWSTPFLKVVDKDGKEVPSQIVSRADHRITVLFSVKLPSVGYAVYFVCPAKDNNRVANSPMSVSPDGLESDCYRVRLDVDGNIASVWDKKVGRELLRGPMTYQMLHNHIRHYGSWEIGYEDVCAEPVAVVGGPAQISVLQDGPCRVALQVVRAKDACVFSQVISLDFGGAFVRVDNDVVWNETAMMLKAAFPLNVDSDVARYDAGLGSIERPDCTEIKFEVPVHKWAHMYDEKDDYGVTIVNDCKYAMDKKQNVLRLTCIHTPAAPFIPEARQDMQDFGQNVYSFAITGTKGDFVVGQAEKWGTVFNQKPVVCQTTCHPGMMPKNYSFMTISDGLALKAVKLAEDSDEIIVRVVESEGHKHDVARISFAPNVLSVRSVNGYEQPVADPVSQKGNDVEFSIGHFAPRTFAVRLASPSETAKQNTYTPIILPKGNMFTSFRQDAGLYGIGPDCLTVPREWISDWWMVEGIPFEPQKDKGQLTFFTPDGFKIPLANDTTQLCLIGSKKDRDGFYTLSFEDVDGKTIKEMSLSVQAYFDDIGDWDQIARNHFGHIDEDRVALAPCHLHDKNGDVVSGRFAFYLYTIIVPHGAAKVVLKHDENMMIAAMTAVTRNPETKLVTDIAIRKAKPIPRQLTVHGGIGSGIYMPGQQVIVAYNGSVMGEVTWKRNDGEVIKAPSLWFAMPDCDVELTADVSPYALSLANGCRVLAGNEDEEHKASFVTDDSLTTMWKAGIPYQNYVMLDLGEKQIFNHVVLWHSGICTGDQSLNTKALRIEVLQGGKWSVVSQITNNTSAITIHDFAPVTSCFVRVVIDVPTANGLTNRASLVKIGVYADTGLKPQCDYCPISGYDVTDLQLKEDELTHAELSETKEDLTVRFDSPVRMTKWHMTGAKYAVLHLFDRDGNEVYTDIGQDVVEPDMIHRLVPFVECKEIHVTNVNRKDEHADFVAYGMFTALNLVQSWLGNSFTSRNPLAHTTEDGSIVLPVIEGPSAHDMYGQGLRNVTEGYYTMTIRVKVPREDMASLANECPLFCFNPGLPNRTDPMSSDITVGDYLESMRDVNGFRVFKASFYAPMDGKWEMRIVNHRHASLTVAEMSLYSGKESE